MEEILLYKEDRNLWFGQEFGNLEKLSSSIGVYLDYGKYLLMELDMRK